MTAKSSNDAEISGSMMVTNSDKIGMPITDTTIVMCAHIDG